MVKALNENKIPNAYVTYEGEGHGQCSSPKLTFSYSSHEVIFYITLLGFRKPENIIRTLELELWFYGKIFGFPVDGIEGVEIANYEL